MGSRIVVAWTPSNCTPERAVTVCCQTRHQLNGSRGAGGRLLECSPCILVSPEKLGGQRSVAACTPLATNYLCTWYWTVSHLSRKPDTAAAWSAVLIQAAVPPSSPTRPSSAAAAVSRPAPRQARFSSSNACAAGSYCCCWCCCCCGVLPAAAAVAAAWMKAMRAWQEASGRGRGLQGQATRNVSGNTRLKPMLCDGNTGAHPQQEANRLHTHTASCTAQG